MIGPIPGVSPMWPAPDPTAPDVILEQAREAERLVQAGQDILDQPFTPSSDRPSLTTRMIAFRTYAGQLEKLLADNGIEIPQRVREFNPDSRFSPLYVERASAQEAK